MNKIKHLVTAPILFLLAAVSFTSQNKTNSLNNNIIEVNATTHVDNFADYIYSGSYYESITANDEGLNGNLRVQLSNLIVPSAFPSYSGSGDNALSSLLQGADEDPTNSNNMIYFYTRDSVEKNAASSWNREHTWPKSLSGGNWGEGKAGADLLHIRPTYNTTNSTRSNCKFADLNKSGSELTYEGMPYGWKSSSNFEPLDSVKGDAARIVMYLYVAYQNVYSNMPYITNVFESYDTLLKWHISDTPDLLEGNRNNYAEASIQKNRNPFVDHPEYACKIFGTNASASVKQACYEKYGGTSQYDDLVSLSINKSSLNLKSGESETLIVTPDPSTAYPYVNWSTSNGSVATVSSDGKVTALNVGTATITATSSIDSSIKATCTVTVTKSETIVNSIKNCYSIASGTSVSNIYGIYVGTSDGKSPIIMNGEYGITLYGGSLDNSWVKNQTVLKVSGTLDIYNNLYEIKSYSASTITDEEEIANNVSPIVTYTVNGSETSSDTSLASRLCLVSGTVATASDSNNDYKATITLSNSETVNLFVKSTYKETLKNIIVAGATLTLKGFTSIHYSTFQVSVFENVTIDESYTANDFATELMNKTDNICASSTNKAGDLSPVWIDLEQNCYSKLSESEKNTLLISGATYKTGTTIEQAMDRYDYIVSHYNLNNFINRNITKSDIRINFLTTSESRLLLILSLTGLSFAAITLTFILIKRKVNKE